MPLGLNTNYLKSFFSEDELNAVKMSLKSSSLRRLIWNCEIPSIRFAPHEDDAEGVFKALKRTLKKIQNNSLDPIIVIGVGGPHLDARAAAEFVARGNNLTLETIYSIVKIEDEVSDIQSGIDIDDIEEIAPLLSTEYYLEGEYHSEESFTSKTIGKVFKRLKFNKACNSLNNFFKNCCLHKNLRSLYRKFDKLFGKVFLWTIENLKIKFKLLIYRGKLIANAVQVLYNDKPVCC